MVQLTSTQQVHAQLQPVDRMGNPASIEEGSVQVTSNNESVAVIDKDPVDEKKFSIRAVGIGVAQVDFSADADLGEGVKTIAGFVGVEVIPAEATGFGLALSEVEEQPVTEG